MTSPLHENLFLVLPLMALMAFLTLQLFGAIGAFFASQAATQAETCPHSDSCDTSWFTPPALGLRAGLWFVIWLIAAALCSLILW